MISSVLKVLKYQYFLWNQSLANCGSTKIFSTKFSLFTHDKMHVYPSCHMTGGDWNTAVVLAWYCAFELRRVTKPCGPSLLVLSLAVEGGLLPVCASCFNQPQAVSPEHLEYIVSLGIYCSCNITPLILLLTEYDCQPLGQSI